MYDIFCEAETVSIARCPEHGLHGERTECFVCHGPVEQVQMVPLQALLDVAEAHRRVVANESNHYDRYWTPPVDAITEEWLDDTEEKMRDALTDVFCDDAAAVMLTLIGEIRRLRVAA